MAEKNAELEAIRQEIEYTLADVPDGESDAPPPGLADRMDVLAEMADDAEADAAPDEGLGAPDDSRRVEAAARVQSYLRQHLQTQARGPAANYNPDQPRHPAGTAGGGQFAATGDASAVVDVHDPRTGEVYWTGPRHEGERMLREQEEVEPGHGLQLRPSSTAAREDAARQEEERRRAHDEAVAERQRLASLKTPHGLLPGHPDYVDPPDILYHATFAADAIQKEGFKSSDELGRQTLGGSSGHLTSFTTRENAASYRDALNVARRAARGELSDKDLTNVGTDYGVGRDQMLKIIDDSSHLSDKSFNVLQRVSLEGKKFPLFMGTAWPAHMKEAPPASLVGVRSSDVKEIYYNPGESEWRVGKLRGVQPIANYNPDQPRHPAGTGVGGRFAPAEGAGVAAGAAPSVRPQATRLRKAGATKEERAEIGRLGRERTRLGARIKEGTATTAEVRRRKEVVDEIAARKKAVKERVAKESVGSKTTDTSGNVTVEGGTKDRGIGHVDHASEAVVLHGHVQGLEAISGGLVHLSELRIRMHHLSKDDFDKTLQESRRQGLVTLSGAEGRHGLREIDRLAGVHEEDPLTGRKDRLLLYASSKVAGVSTAGGAEKAGGTTLSDAYVRRRDHARDLTIKAEDISRAANDAQGHRRAAEAHTAAEIEHGTLIHYREGGKSPKADAIQEHTNATRYHNHEARHHDEQADRLAATESTTGQSTTAGSAGPGGFLYDRTAVSAPTLESHDRANRLGTEALDASARASSASTHSMAALAHREAHQAHAEAASRIENDPSTFSGSIELQGANRQAAMTHRTLAARHQAEAEGHEAKANSMAQANPGRPATPLTIKEVRDHVKKDPSLGEISQVMQLMRTHHGESGLVQEHGMSKPEEMHHLEMGGIKFHYPQTEQGREAAAGTIVRLAFGAHKIPAPLWQAQTDVVHSSQRNGSDPYWAVQYKDPGFRAHATGGGGKTVVYGMEPGSPKPGPYSTDVSSFAHEAGHNFAKNPLGWAGLTPPAGSAYHAAQQKEQPVTEYARNSPSEDFAEAAMMYTVMPRTFKEKFPLKHQAFHDLMEAHGGGVTALRS